MGGFAAVDPAKGAGDLFKPIVGRGSAHADIDGDGDPDVALAQLHGPPLLLRNDQQLDHNWLRVKLEGRTANRDGIGAWIRLQSGGKTQWRLVTPTRSYLSQSEIVATFGLGKAGAIEELAVTWPGGKEQMVEPPKVNSLVTIQQPL